MLLKSVLIVIPSKKFVLIFEIIINKEVLHGHLENCVQNALCSDDAGEKIKEIMAVIDKLSK